MSQVFTGGCQCGAIRYRAEKAPQDPHLCHCRMCQKASGNYFMPLAGVSHDDFVVTRGEISWFASSDVVRRGFCGACGTPLFFETIGESGIAVALGSLDRPELVKPTSQSDVYARLPWFQDLAGLPASGPVDAQDSDDNRQQIHLSNHQHPDHDTAAWPPRTST